jgi:hypothetical protein
MAGDCAYCSASQNDDWMLRAIAVRKDHESFTLHKFCDNNALVLDGPVVATEDLLASVDGQAIVVGDADTRLVIKPATGLGPYTLLDDVGRALMFARRMQRVAWEAAVVAIRQAHDDGLTNREIAIFLRCDLESVEEALAIR